MRPLRVLVLIVSLGSGCAFDASGTRVDPAVDPTVEPDAAIAEPDATVAVDAGTPDAKPGHGHGDDEGKGPGFD